MPSRNIYKQDVENTYYHVYARGICRQPIFNERADCEYFIGLLARYLSPGPTKNSVGVLYPHFHEIAKLLSYCLMGNHFHLLFYQVEQGAMPALMRSIMTSYSGYFNFKYKRSGPLFESRYKAVRIADHTHLEHISRYIHLNPRYWKRYPYSSFMCYIKGNEPEWLTTKNILGMFDSREDYQKFVADYESQKTMLEKIKHSLADY